MDKMSDRLQYEEYEFVMGIPPYLNTTEEFGIQEDTPLPEGFTLNAETGEVMDKPVREMEVAELVVGKLPKKTFLDHPVAAVLKSLVQPEDLRVMQALDRVVRLLLVGSKRFLWLLWLVWLVTSKVERWVRGLIARQQCCTCR